MGGPSLRNPSIYKRNKSPSRIPDLRPRDCLSTSTWNLECDALVATVSQSTGPDAREAFSNSDSDSDGDSGTNSHSRQLIVPLSHMPYPA